MTKPYPELNDDLSDLLGGAPAAPRALPTDAGLVRAREAAEAFTEVCPKCRGTGKFIGYTGRVFGDCFTCKGAGKRSYKTAPEVRAQARQRTATAKAAVVADHQAELAWLAETLARRDRLPEGYATMLADFQSRLLAGHELSEKQAAVIAKGMARSAEWAAQRQQKAAEKVAAAPGFDATKLLEGFAKAAQKGLQEPVLFFDGFVIYEAKKHPGTFYVKAGLRYGQTYFGKIVDGRFIASRDCTPEMQAAILLVLDDPGAAARAYGKKTRSCSCCGRKLTNEASIAAGIGPICAAGWGF